MKIVLLTFQSGKEDWVKLVIEKYQKKISHYYPLEIVQLKSPATDREDAKFKKQIEEEVFVSKIKTSDFVIAFDEHGIQPSDSKDMSLKLNRALESSKQRIVLVVGGAFGIGEKVLTRADLKISLSSLTFSHHVALTVILEQIYRSFTIIKNQPYHNS